MNVYVWVIYNNVKLIITIVYVIKIQYLNVNHNYIIVYVILIKYVNQNIIIVAVLLNNNVNLLNLKL
jgi:hypothetical protein